MAKFDRSLDENLFTKEVSFETTKIVVSIFSYNGGAKKLQLSRENLNPESGDWVFSKLGRMRKEEVEGVLPLIKEAYELM